MRILGCRGTSMVGYIDNCIFFLFYLLYYLFDLAFEPSLIDLFFTTHEDSVEHIDIHSPLGKSDHSLIKVKYRSRAEEMPTKIVCDYEKADYEKMKQHLDIDWISLLKGAGEDIEKSLASLLF